MTDIDKLMEKLNTFHTAVKKQAASNDGCPPGHEMVDGECVPMKQMSQEKTMEPTKQPETVEKKPEEQAKPAPAVPSPLIGPEPDKKTDARISGLEDKIQGVAGTLNAIAEKVSGLVLNAEVKGQSETLKNSLERVEKLAETLTAAQPPAQLNTNRIPMQDYKAIDMTPGSNSKLSIEERAAKYARAWGMEPKEETEVPITQTKAEENPTEVRLSALDKKVDSTITAINSIADKLTGLVETLSRNPASPVAPAPAGPVIPVVSKDKKSISSERKADFFDWDSDMNHGKSIAERAQLLAETLGRRETA